MTVYALDTVTLLEGSTDIRLTVESWISCPVSDGSAGVHVENALLIKYLIENKPHTDVMPRIIEGCLFHIVEMTPSDLGKYKIVFRGK